MPKPLRNPRRSAPVPQFQIVVASGTIRGPVVVGRSVAGEPLCSFDLHVDDAGGRCLVPVTWRGVENPGLDTGDAVAVRGRIAKRFHRAGAATIARTSLDAVEVLRAPRATALERLTARALVAGASGHTGA